MYEVTFDLETTGLDLIHDAPVQFACLVHARKKDERSQLTRKTRLINPGDQYLPIPEGATNVHGIRDEDVIKEGISAADFCDFYHKLIWKYQPATVIGYNIANFDFPLLQNFLLKHHENRFKHPPILGVFDVMHYASYMLGTKKWLKLGECAKHLSVPYNPSLLHDAMEDVIVTQRVYVALRELQK